MRHLLACVFPLVLAACIVEQSPAPPPDTAIGFDEQLNFKTGCGTLTSWTVTLREEQSTVTGGCNDQILFHQLAPATTYTFDLLGYAGNNLCWQGACTVPSQAGLVTYGDCSGQIEFLCK